MTPELTATPNDLIPANEAERIAAVRRYDILDTPPDGAFDRVTSIAARLFGVPIAIVSIVDSDRIWFKSHHGLDAQEIPREPGLCASAILHDSAWVVEDAEFDPRTLANPLVAGDFGLRFYAGVPLHTRDGYNLGTLCVIDREPRTFSADDLAILDDLAAIVMDELELRLHARRAIAREAEARRIAEDLSQTLQESLLPTNLPDVPGLEFACRYHVAARDRVGGDFYDVIKTAEGCAVVVGDVCGKGSRAAALTGTARWTLRSASLNGWNPARVLHRLNDVITRAFGEEERYVTVAFANVVTTDTGAELSLSLGGHPHPIVIRAGGDTEQIGYTAPIVGWKDDVPFQDVTVTLGHGDVVVFFTDGLQDAVRGDQPDQPTTLATTLGAVAGKSPDAVAGALDELLADDKRDDAAFLVLRVA